MHQLLVAFGIDWRLLLAQVINFGLLLVVLTYFFYNPLMRILEERKNVIARGVTDAKRAGEKLAKADGVAAMLVAKAENSAEDILKSARVEAQTEKTQLIKEADERAADIVAGTEARAKEVATKIVRESEREIARLAVLATKKILQEQ